MGLEQQAQLDDLGLLLGREMARMAREPRGRGGRIVIVVEFGIRLEWDDGLLSFGGHGGCEDVAWADGSLLIKREIREENDDNVDMYSSWDS